MPHGFEPSHLALSLAGRFVGYLGPVVLPAVLRVRHTRQYFLASGPVADQLVGYDQARDVAQTLQQLPEEARRGSFVAAFLHQNIEHIAVLVDSPPQVAPLSANGDEDFVEEPGVARTAWAATQGSGVRLAELETPLPDRLVADDDAALSQEIFDIPKTEAKAVIELHGVGDDLPRIAVAGIGIRR